MMKSAAIVGMAVALMTHSADAQSLYVYECEINEWLHFTDDNEVRPYHHSVRPPYPNIPFSRKVMIDKSSGAVVSQRLSAGVYQWKLIQEGSEYEAFKSVGLGWRGVPMWDVFVIDWSRVKAKSCHRVPAH
jgi:hypothetical protein